MVSVGLSQGPQDQEAGATAQEPGSQTGLSTLPAPSGSTELHGCHSTDRERLRPHVLAPFLQPSNRRELNFKLCDPQEE